MTANANVSKSTGGKRSLVRYFKDVKNELKKVIWPTREQLVNNTVTVLLTCLVIGALIWIVDSGLANVLKVVLGK